MNRTVNYYRMRVGDVFTEVPDAVMDTRTNPLCTMVAIAACIWAGKWFTGAQSIVTPDEFVSDFREVCMLCNTHPDYAMEWAKSLLILPDETLSKDEQKAVPSTLKGWPHTLYPYQIQEAAWAAHRMGSVMNFGCGVGKSAAATSAAIAAARLGKCKRDRCFIIAPRNAMNTWDAYREALEDEFEQVIVYSTDSLHHFEALSYDKGGALIYDEAHACKNEEKNRSKFAHILRPKFQWATCLTGSLLLTGCEACISIMNLACPGLARYSDKYAFGERFEAIEYVEFERRGRTVRAKKLRKPKDGHRDRFVNYLMRGSRSLRFESKSVKHITNVPPQKIETIDKWPRPEWLTPYFSSVPDPDNPTAIWLPEYEWKEAAAYMAIAMYHDRLADFKVEARNMLGYEITASNREGAVEELEKIYKADPRDKTPHNIAKLGKFPEISGIIWALLGEGLYDRAIVAREPKPDDLFPAIFQFEYAPGSTKDSPLPGPKIRWLEGWMRDHPEEQVVIGAATVKALDSAVALLDKMNLSYSIIRGGVPNKDRKVAVDNFQTGRCHAILLQQIAGSVSITLTAAARSILIDHSMQPDPYEQYLGRTHRVGQTRRTIHYDVCFGDFHKQIVEGLRDGKSFDESIRTQLEEIVQRVGTVFL